MYISIKLKTVQFFTRSEETRLDGSSPGTEGRPFKISGVGRYFKQEKIELNGEFPLLQFGFTERR